MDKSKSRTDLLAAGRKRLQQFRQKKDGKGSGSNSQGKPSKNHGKVGKHDAGIDSVSSGDRSTESSSSHVIEDEISQQHVDSSLGSVDSSVSLSVDYVTPETDGNKADDSSVLPIHVTDVEGHNVASQTDLPLDEAGPGSPTVSAKTEALVSEVDSVHSSQFLSADSVGRDTDANCLQTENDHLNISLTGVSGSHMVDGSLSEVVLEHELTEEPPKMLDVDTVISDVQVNATETDPQAEERNISTRETSNKLSSEVETLQSDSLRSLSTPIEVVAGTSSSLSQDVEVKHGHPIHEMFLHVKEDQLADDGNTVDFEPKIEFPLESLPVRDAEDSAPDERESTMEHELEVNNLRHPSGASETSPPVLETSRSISLLPASEELNAVTGDIHILETEAKDVSPQHNVPDLSLLQAREDQEVDIPGREQLVSSSEIEVDEDRTHLEEQATTKAADMGFGQDVSLRFSQLVNDLKELNEDEFKLLVKLRNSNVQAIAADTDILSEGEPNHDIADVLDAYKEQIYVANVTKDIFSVQLVEQSKQQLDTDHIRQQCDDKVSKLEISLEECKERNKKYDEELAMSRSELMTALKNIEELSSAVHDWQDKFYRSQDDLSVISKDLSDCRSLVETLHMEKENLSESLKLMEDERKQYAEEKDIMFKENEKLQLEIVELKSQLADGHFQSASLIDNLNLVTEDKRKLEDERVSLVQENAVLSSELAECKSLLADVQAKHSNATESIFILTEEKHRLLSQNNSFMLDYEKLTAELTECNNRLAHLEAENSKLSANLSSAAEEKRKLEEENRCLLHEYEVISSENRGIQEELLSARTVQIHLEADRNKDDLRLEQLIEENIFLHICFEVLKSKIREVSDKACEGSSEPQHSINKIDESYLVVEPSSNCRSATLLPHDGFTPAIWNEHLDMARRAIHNLDKAIEELHAHPSDVDYVEGSATGVSKLIQTSKPKNLSKDLEEGESNVQSSDSCSVSPLSLVKERAKTVKAVLKQLFLVAENANELFMEGVENRHIDDAADGVIDVQYTAMHEHAVDLERYNIDLQVQNEVLKENALSIMAKYSESDTRNELLHNRLLTLELENNTYAKKLKDSQSRVTDLHNQLLDIKQNFGEMAPSTLKQIKNTQIEIAEEILGFENHWNSIVTQIIGFVGRLDSFSSGLLVPADPPVSEIGIEIANCVGTSVDSAITFIKRLQDDFEALKSEYQSLDCLYKELHGTYMKLSEENTASIDMLHKVHGSLRNIVIALCRDENGSPLDIEPLLDPCQISDYMMLIEHVSSALHEKVQLQSENAKLRSELDNRTKGMEEMDKSYLDMHVIIAQLVKHVEEELKLSTLDILPLTLRLENCISSLLQAHKEAGHSEKLFKEEGEVAETRGVEMLAELQQLNSLKIQLENEIESLRLSLSRAEDQLSGVQTELQKKVAEVGQSEQRVSSIREKLSIAVAKGKGLIVQRDNLKQSLAETSSELENARQQLQLSDSRLLEAETKLKTYAEAGERVEALESELSYIRNSATALRESFLLKDSVLQRIEEILEDLELPDHLHSREIIDKVEWLARSVVGHSNTVPSTDWDQKSSPDGGSYTDNGFVVMDAWKDDTQHNSSSNDDLRRKHEELQNKFYALAEQNEMLEQSLMERNNVVQRLEEVLDKINMPAHLRSMETESRIEWLGNALSDAHQHASALQESLDHLETHCEKLTTELEESQRSSSDIKSVLELTIKDKESLQGTLADLTRDADNVHEKAATLELENNKLQTVIDNLEEKLAKNKDYSDEVESGIRRMVDLICNAIYDPSVNETASIGCNISDLEEILRKLIDDHSRLSTAIQIPQEIDVRTVEKADSAIDESGELASSDHNASIVNTLKKELEEALDGLTVVKEERDSYMEKHKSLSDEIEAVRKRDEELKQLLNQEEQKSASLREKLNVAVRKGKSLVQQRDGLKQTIEEMNARVDNLTSEINNQQSTITQYEEKCKELSSYTEKVQALESEKQLLRSQLTEAERYLHEEGRKVSLILDSLNGIKLNDGFISSDPIDKLQQLGKAYHDLLEAKASSDQESVKSKRAAELLLAELNEVQERNDGLQDDLAKLVDEVSELSKANQILEADKAEALSQLTKFSAAQNDEQRKRNAQLVELKSGVDQLKKCFEDTIHLLTDVFSMDMEFFKSLELCLNASDGIYAHGGTLLTEHSDNQKMFFNNGIPAWEKFVASDSWLTCKTQEQFRDNAMNDICRYLEHQVHECASEISNVKEKLQSYLILKAQEATRVSTNLRRVQGEIISHIQALEKAKEIEKGALLKNIALLYQACVDSIHEVENWKAHMRRDNPSSMDMTMNVISTEAGDDFLLSKDHIGAISERLTACMKDLSNTEEEVGKADHLEMKNTIANLQKEIQEKDMQKERMCMELVGQIKRAEATATNYSRDLEVATAKVHDLETQVSAIGKEKTLLEQMMKEMEDWKSASVELQERVRSMTDLISSKDQEIESLMQALDEEESELEEMSKKVEQKEHELQQKNKEMGKLESSYNKVLKKLSVTVSKFDELHDLSANLLTEVEKLQSQVQEKDKEISFLRQEVTRCTNDILLASQSKISSDDIIELFEWLKTVTSRVDLMVASPKDKKPDDAHAYKESIQNQIASIISELEDLRGLAERRNEMLQAEKSKVQELTRKGESLETALHQKEAQLNLLEEAPTSSEIREIEPLENNWAVSGPSTTSQVRSLRKSNNDQVTIAIEDDSATSGRLEDEDEDKVHGFKSLTTSRLVPRFTRPVSDMIDGLWVSCDRALMRQPALRLSIILYWALLHSLLAAFVV